MNAAWWDARGTVAQKPQHKVWGHSIKERYATFPASPDHIQREVFTQGAQTQPHEKWVWSQHGVFSWQTSNGHVTCLQCAPETCATQSQLLEHWQQSCLLPRLHLMQKPHTDVRSQRVPHWRWLTFRFRFLQGNYHEIRTPTALANTIVREPLCLCVFWSLINCHMKSELGKAHLGM